MKKLLQPLLYLLILFTMLTSSLYAADSLNAITGPNTISKGEEVTITVDFEASTNRTIAVYFQSLNPKKMHFYKRIGVHADDTSKEVSFTIPDDIPSNGTFRYKAYIAPKGGKYSSNLGVASQEGVKSVDVPVNDDIKSITGPSTITKGERVTLKVDYVASQERTIAVYFQSLNPKKMQFYKRIMVDAGDELEEVTFTVPNDIPTHGTFRYKAYIAPKGGKYLSSLGVASQEGVRNTTRQALGIYNQAYQENYASDKIDDILAHARGAYVLLDALEDDIGPYVSQIKAKGNQVSGYISVGTGEDYRNDFTDLEPYLTSTAWSDWPDEYFVSEVTTGILSLMKKRIDKIATWGADWIEFDNMDWLDEDSRRKFNLTATVKEAKAYINALCDYTHRKGIKCMAKNTVEGFEDFDGVLYESFSEEKNWWDTAGTKSFLNAGKLVIINHYNESDCDGVYRWYKNHYNSDKISFICEDKHLKKYKHYNE